MPPRNHPSTGHASPRCTSTDPFRRRRSHATPWVVTKELLNLVTRKPYAIGAHQDIITEGEVPNDVHLIVSGLAYRHKILRQGKKQIVAYLLPGDFCDLHIFILDKMDHSISALTDCQVVSIPRDTVLRLSERPAIARALWWATLVDEGRLREALVNIGQRQAEERLSHFLCEMMLRLDAVGLVVNNTFDLPVTQHDLANTLGLSTVHINRVSQKLRHRNLVKIDHKRVTVPDLAALKASCDFDANYLHLEPYQPKAEPRRSDHFPRF